MAYQNLNYTTSQINNLLNKCENIPSGGGGSTSGYISNTTMSSTYLTKVNASNSYQPKGNYLTTSDYNTLLDTTSASNMHSSIDTYSNNYYTVAAVKDYFYPVGSVIMFYSYSYDPGTILGGTWTRLEGVIYGNNGSSFGAINSDSVTLTNTQTPQSVPTFTLTAALPADHSHSFPDYVYASDSTIGQTASAAISGSGKYYQRMSSNIDLGGAKNGGTNNSSHTHSVSITRSYATSSVSKIQKCIPVYIWRRTA